MPKKTYMILTAALTCLALSAAVPAEENAAAAEDNTAEETAVSEVTALPYNPNEPIEDAYTPPYDPEAELTDIDIYVPDDIAYEQPVPNDNAPAPNDNAEDADKWSYALGTGDIEDIYKYWESYGYPEDVSYVADNSLASYEVATQTTVVYNILEIGVVNADEGRKQEIRALISPQYYVSFADCEYSHSRRLEIKEEIESKYPMSQAELAYDCQDIWVYLDNYSDEEIKEITESIDQIYNKGGLSLVYVVKTVTTEDIGEVPEIGIPETAIEEPAIATAPASNEDNYSMPGGIQNDTGIDAGIDIGIDNAGIDSAGADNNVYSAPAAAAGGIDDHNSESLSSAAETTETVGEIAAITVENNKKDGSIWIWLCAVAAAAAAIAAAVVIGRAKQSRNLSLAEGGEVPADGAAGRAEVIKAIKESEIEPSESAFNEIMEKIKGEENSKGL